MEQDAAGGSTLPAMKSALRAVFETDHRRLNDLLPRAMGEPDRIDSDVFGEFRGLLLKHIGMEEKILYLAGRLALREATPPIFAKLRVDHGALAALLVPTPTPAIATDLLSILVPHGQREEEAGGIYDLCIDAISSELASVLLEETRAFREVPLKPYNDDPVVFGHIRRNLDLSRQQWR